jgi:hypothetical protein
VISSPHSLGTPRCIKKKISNLTLEPTTNLEINSNLLQWPRAAILPLWLRSDTRRKTEDTLIVGDGGTTLLQTKWSGEDANQRASYDSYPYGTKGRRDKGYTTTRIKGIPTNNSFFFFLVTGSGTWCRVENIFQK